MFCFPAFIAAQALQAKYEAERWARLSSEQKAEELRLREVRAMERQAQALEEISRKKLTLF